MSHQKIATTIRTTKNFAATEQQGRHYDQSGNLTATNISLVLFFGAISIPEILPTIYGF